MRPRPAGSMPGDGVCGVIFTSNWPAAWDIASASAKVPTIIALLLHSIESALYGCYTGNDWKNATMTNAPGKARGVLRPHFAQGEFRHERLLPPAALADHIEHFWFVQWDLR